MKPRKPKPQVIRFPGQSTDPKILLHNAAIDHGDQLDDVVILASTKEGKSLILASTHQPTFLCVAQTLLTELAIDAVNGRIPVSKG